MEQNTNTFSRLCELLDARDYPAFMRTIDEVNPPDAAEWMESLPAERLLPVFRMLKKDTAAEIFAELDHDAQQTIIEAITDRELGAIIEELFVDDAVDMLEELPAGVVKRVLAAAQPETRALINQFLSYPEDSAGSVMTAEFLDLRGQTTVADAIEQIRRTHLDRETVHMAYITDETRASARRAGCDRAVVCAIRRNAGLSLCSSGNRHRRHLDDR